MRKRQLRTIAKSMQTLHKKSSDTYKKSRELDEKAAEEFWELVIRLSKKYNCKIITDKDDGNVPKSVYSNCVFLDESLLNYMYRTSFNSDFEGEFNIGLMGNLSLKQINEIKNLTGAVLDGETSEPNGYYSYYAFYFDFDNYWNEGYQF